MPVPSISAVGQTARKMAMPSVFLGFAAHGATSGYRERVQHGTNPMLAALMETASLVPQFALSPGAHALIFSIGMPLARASTAAVVGAVREHNNFIRQAKTPFSHRFEHTAVTLRAQQLGLQQIGAAWGHANMGTEAGAFSKRYCR